MSFKPALWKILKGIIHTEEEENNHKYERWGKNNSKEELMNSWELEKYQIGSMQ
jgi:hypothetical protein